MNVPPRVLALVVAGNAALLPTAMRPLVLVLLGHANTGSYAVAGAGAATAAVGLAVTAPPLGRALHRYGYRRVLLVAGAVSIVTHVGLAVTRTPAAFVALCALLGLTTPPVLASVRTVIARLVPPGGVSRVYALNASIQELVYVAGPLAVTGAVAVGGARTALLTCAAVGAAALVVAAVVAPGRPEDEAPTSAPAIASSTALATAALRTLITVHIGYMWCMGAMWVLVPAFAAHTGHPGQAGLLVTVWSLGSLAGGLVVTARGRRGTAARAYPMLLGLLAAASLPLALASTVSQMAVVIAVFGLGLSPWLATADELVSASAAAGRTGEAYGWLVTAGQAGSAGGSALAGFLADRAGGGTSFLVVTAALAAALTVALLRRHTFPTTIKASLR
ncbi:MFS transporter [Actinomycetes bacterium KLBMP 9797]